MQKIYYYKVMAGNTYLGKINSYNMRYFNPKHKKMFCCFENKAQFIQLNDSFYHANTLLAEPDFLKGKYITVQLIMISESEFNKLN